MKKTLMTAAVITALVMAGSVSAHAQSQEGNFESNVQSEVNDNHEELAGNQKDMKEVKDLNDLNDKDLINDQKGVNDNVQDILNDEKAFLNENRDLLADPKELTGKD